MTLLTFATQELDNAIKGMDGRPVEGPEKGPMFKIQVHTAILSLVLTFFRINRHALLLADINRLVLAEHFFSVFQS